MVRVVPIDSGVKSIEWTSTDVAVIREQSKEKLTYIDANETKHELESEMWTLPTELGEDGNLHMSMQMHTNMVGIMFLFQGKQSYDPRCRNEIMTAYIINEIPRMYVTEQIAMRSNTDMCIKVGLPVLASIIDYANIDTSEIMTTDMYIWADAVWRPGGCSPMITCMVTNASTSTSLSTEAITVMEGNMMASLVRLQFEIENVNADMRRLRGVIMSAHMEFPTRGYSCPHPISRT
ncbi:uncharacterized protein CDV56_102748 [Aspergillus thermomutatus]|uniref:Uncharacterized protein n=1 Tax=Aspergillus thermomutatus TaxID=41047 RepID=A0A397FYK4_ASPTH|nr:uncharacterized protein CDV56_102748 [Aspergillus thermomutatus]RHZ43841.1 hypothetical protein CDV56_102748 [Aspergillus thermomutatus]